MTSTRRSWFLSLAFCVKLSGAFVPVCHADAKIGPEIELQGPRHLPGLVCTLVARPAVSSGVLAAATSGLLAGPVVAALMKFDPSALAFTSFGAGSAASGGMILFSIYCNRNKSALGVSANDRYLERISRELEPLAREGKVTVKKVGVPVGDLQSVRVTYPTGEVIEFGRDPNTIEVHLNPMPASELKSKEKFLQAEIFDRAARVGLRPPRWDGPWNGGHVHVDIETGLKSDPANLKKAVFDYVSHGELAGGLLCRDRYNARPISLRRNRADLERLGKYLDGLKAEGKKLTPPVLHQLVRDFPKIFGKRSALNLKPSLGTLEFRALRAQASAEVLADVALLVSASIEYTNGLPDVPLPRSDGLGAPGAWPERYRQYVEERGLSYDRFKKLIPGKYWIDDLRPCLLRRFLAN